jgi:uncharacterized protein YndB with AHSA1/START domain
VSVVRVERIVEAPPERAFDAWLDPERAGRWLFATPAGEIVRVAIEAWAGGRYEIVERRDGEEVLHTGTYQAVERPDRLVFTLAVPKSGDGEAQVSVRFEAAGAATRIVLEQPAPAAMAARIRDGWAAILDGLATQVESGGDPGETQAGAARLI